jgi:hypothetical protein
LIAECLSPPQQYAKMSLPVWQRSRIDAASYVPTARRSEAGRRSAGELARCIKVPQNPISVHLAILARAKLIVGQRQSRPFGTSCSEIPTSDEAISRLLPTAGPVTSVLADLKYGSTESEAAAKAFADASLVGNGDAPISAKAVEIAQVLATVATARVAAAFNATLAEP